MKLAVEDVAELMYGGDVEGIETVDTSIVTTTRWSIVKRLIFPKDGELWGFDYEVGATESQEYDPEEKVCFPVEVVQLPAYRKAKR